MIDDTLSVPDFRLVNFHNMCGMAAVFDLAILGVGRIQDVLYARKDPSKPGKISCIPLASARESVDGDFVTGSGRLPFRLEEPLVGLVLQEVERVLDVDRKFQRANGYDIFSEVVLPSQRELEVDWRD